MLVRPLAYLADSRLCHPTLEHSSPFVFTQSSDVEHFLYVRGSDIPDTVLILFSCFLLFSSLVLACIPTVVQLCHSIRPGVSILASVDVHLPSPADGTFLVSLRQKREEELTFCLVQRPLLPLPLVFVAVPCPASVAVVVLHLISSRLDIAANHPSCAQQTTRQTGHVPTHILVTPTPTPTPTQGTIPGRRFRLFSR